MILLLLIGIDRSGWAPALRPFTSLLYSWMLVLSACGLLLGVVNVIRVHWERIRDGGPDWALSLVLLAVLLAVAGAGLMDLAGVFSPFVEWAFASVIVPLQSAFFALTAFFLVAAAYRYLRVGNPGGGWMVAGALLVLSVQAPVGRLVLPSAVANATDWLLVYPVMAALRGVLLGSSLALIVVGLRFLLQRDG
jgi:hypothetical protein